MKKILRAVARVVGVLAVLVIIAGGTLYFTSQRRLDRKWSVAAHAVTVPGDALALARGRHLAVAISKCADCQGADLGGAQFIDEPPVARLYATNLTRGKGGIGATRTPTSTGIGPSATPCDPTATGCSSYPPWNSSG